MSLANLKSWGFQFWTLWFVAAVILSISLLIPGTSYSSNTNGIKSLLAIIAIIIDAILLLKLVMPAIPISWRTKR